MPRRSRSTNFRMLALTLAVVLPMILAACAAGVGTTYPAAQAVSGSASDPTGVPSVDPAATLPAGAIRLVLASDGNEARYTVTEQLADRPLPSDAVGRTSAVTGQIVIGADGRVVAQGSLFTIDMTTLHSDSNRRDGFIQRNTLQTDRYPTAVFAPTEVRGLPVPLPTSGQLTFQVVGNLTVHGLTRPATWDVTAQVSGQELKGTASTAIKFGDFGMQAPKAFVVLSVEDNIRLQYDFHLVPATSAGG